MKFTNTYHFANIKAFVDSWGICGGDYKKFVLSNKRKSVSSYGRKFEIRWYVKKTLMYVEKVGIFKEFFKCLISFDIFFNITKYVFYKKKEGPNKEYQNAQEQ